MTPFDAPTPLAQRALAATKMERVRRSASWASPNSRPPASKLKRSLTAPFGRGGSKLKPQGAEEQGDAAATKVQAMHRGRAVRNGASSQPEAAAAAAADAPDPEMEAAAVRLQSVQRGNVARKQGGKGGPSQPESAAAAAAAAEREAAAVRLQAIQRGNVARKR